MAMVSADISVVEYADGARVPPIVPEAMTLEQRAFLERVVSGPRGRIVGPLRAAIQSPELARVWSEFGEFVRYRTSLPASLNELAILVTGRRWTSQVEWWVHARAGIDAGLSEAVVGAIERLEAPVFDDAAEHEVYEFARHLQDGGQVPDDAYGRVVRRWGLGGAVELTAVVGYYTLVAMTLNAHRIPVPEPHRPLPPATGLVILPRGILSTKSKPPFAGAVGKNA